MTKFLKTALKTGMSKPNTSRTLVFIDTCSLLDSCWNNSTDANGSKHFQYSKSKEAAFWDGAFDDLCAHADCILAKRNFDELKKLSKNGHREDLAKRASYILQKIEPLRKSGQLSIVGDANDPFADAVLLSVALRFRTQKNLVFITQDKNLAHDLASVREFRSIDNRNGYYLEVHRVTKNGSLAPCGSNGANHGKAAVRATTAPHAKNPDPSRKNWWES